MPTKIETITKKNDTMDLNARIAEQERNLAELKAQIARGTGDITEEARHVSLARRLELALRARPHSLEDLVRDLGEPVGRVSSALRQVKKQLYNTGAAELPVWFWIIGDETSPQDLYAAVEALMRARPMAHAELVAATGARENRVSGAINEMRRTRRVVNVGTGKARWFIMPEGVKLARLTRG